MGPWLGFPPTGLNIGIFTDTPHFGENRFPILRLGEEQIVDLREREIEPTTRPRWSADGRYFSFMGMKSGVQASLKSAERGLVIIVHAPSKSVLEKALPPDVSPEFGTQIHWDGSHVVLENLFSEQPSLKQIDSSDQTGEAFYEWAIDMNQVQKTTSALAAASGSWSLRPVSDLSNRIISARKDQRAAIEKIKKINPLFQDVDVWCQSCNLNLLDRSSSRD